MSVLIYSLDSELVQFVEGLLAEARIPCHDLEVAQSASAFKKSYEPPEIVIVDEAALDSLGDPSRSGMDTSSLIFIQRSLDARRTCQAMREGYTAVILASEELHMLPLVVTRTLQERTEKAGKTRPKNASRTIALYSGCGGSGRTTIAAHLISALAASGHRTLGIDLNTQTGTLRHLFGDHGTQSLMDLVPVLDELNESHIRNAVTNLRANLDLLGAPVGGAGSPLDDAEVGKLLDGCGSAYEVLVVDLPSILDQTVTAVLGRSTDAIYILNPDPTGMWALGASLAQWDRWELPRNRLQVIINHRTPSLVSMDVDGKGDLLPLPIQGRIQFDPGIAFSEVMRVWEHPASVSGLAADVTRLARRIMHADVQADQTGEGLLSRLSTLITGAFRRAPATKGG